VRIWSSPYICLYEGICNSLWALRDKNKRICKCICRRRKTHRIRFVFVEIEKYFVLSPTFNFSSNNNVVGGRETSIDIAVFRNRTRSRNNVPHAPRYAAPWNIGLWIFYPHLHFISVHNSRWSVLFRNLSCSFFCSGGGKFHMRYRICSRFDISTIFGCSIFCAIQKTGNSTFRCLEDWALW